MVKQVLNKSQYTGFMSTLFNIHPIKKGKKELVSYFEMEACNYR